LAVDQFAGVASRKCCGNRSEKFGGANDFENAGIGKDLSEISRQFSEYKRYLLPSHTISQFREHFSGDVINSLSGVELQDKPSDSERSICNAREHFVHKGFRVPVIERNFEDADYYPRQSNIRFYGYRLAAFFS
jgi:hypothetical protein